MNIKTLLTQKVRQTGFNHQTDLATGQFWGTTAQLQAELAKADPDATYLNGWSYNITCSDGSGYLKFNGNGFELAPAITPPINDHRIGHNIH